MSYIRYSHDLTFFKTGKSELYVFPTVDGIEDYGAIPKCDNKNLIELIGNICYREEFEHRYGNKYFTYLIVTELAKRMNLLDDLKPYDEIFSEDGYWKY